MVGVIRTIKWPSREDWAKQRKVQSMALADGGYRVKVTDTALPVDDRAWAMELKRRERTDRSVTRKKEKV